MTRLPLLPTVLLVGLLIVTPSAFAQLTTRVVVSGFSAPLELVQDPGDRSTQYVVEQGGRIRVLRNGALQAQDFLNLSGSITSGGERGLLGLAFPKDYATSGRFYVNFTDLQGNTVIARFRRSPDPLVANPASRFDLRWSGVPYIEQPFANHNGGHLVFGPDGYLYIGMGDGGSANDPNNNAQNPNSRLGKFLRVDVNVPDSDATGYRIPPGNPFASSAVPEIWSFGLRNPWKFSFDDPALGGTGGMVIGDVGQNAWEEIDFEPAGRAGRNYGWRNREGSHPNVETLPPAFLPLIDPIFEYDHSVGSSITGGFVYRGRGLPAAMRGRYFFADFVAGRVWSIALSYNTAGEATASGLAEHTSELGGVSTLGNISAFGMDTAGELYIVSYSRGAIIAIVGPPPPPPTNLRIIR
jgi:glucose/arabinose dehydrogenase